MPLGDQRGAAQHVALLAEGVGRNCNLPGQLCPAQVALLAEGVGRNLYRIHWPLTLCWVALLAEGVGRNRQPYQPFQQPAQVALLAEGVGRNPNIVSLADKVFSRPPRGGRG